MAVTSQVQHVNDHPRRRAGAGGHAEAAGIRHQYHPEPAVMTDAREGSAGFATCRRGRFVTGVARAA
jgi:hypothetical protein